MSKSAKHTTDGDATPDPVTAELPCAVVYVRPKSSDATGGYDAMEPYATSQAVRLDEGEGYNFIAEGRLWQTGEIVGFTKTVNAGPFDFLKLHRQEVVR